MAIHLADVAFPSDTNNQIAKHLAVGHRYVFLNSDAIEAIPLPDRDHAAQVAVGQRAIMAIPEDVPLHLAGFQFHSPVPKPVTWLSLTCDRMVYDELSDPINFLIVASHAAAKSIVVEIMESGKPIDSREVNLNSAGIGSLKLSGLPVGEYEAVLKDSSSEPCKFTVARYRLAALVAELQQFKMLDSEDMSVEKTEVSISLSTFGAPFSGALRCDLIEKGKVLISKTVDVADGLANVTFPFQGSDALSVNVQSEDDPSKTATVILQGSSKQDREETTFSNFGIKFAGSMAAAENSKAIRDIHFVNSATSLCPVHIEPTQTGVRITAGTDLDELVIQTLNIGNSNSGRLTVHRKQNLMAEDQWDIEFHEAACHLGAAAFVNDVPWEQWGTFVKPSSLSSSIEVTKPASVDQGAKVKIIAKDGDYAWVIVKDARLPSAESCSLQLSRNIRKRVEQLNFSCDAVKPLSAIRMQSLAGSLIGKGLISDQQLAEAKTLADSTGTSFGQAIISLGYVSSREVAIALAESSRLKYIDLKTYALPESVIEYMPESVARENSVIPLAIHPDGTMFVAAANPMDIDMVENLRFILNRNIEIACATREDIHSAINNYYGRLEGESADSILQQFTDTAIDFTSSVVLEDSGDLLVERRIEIGRGRSEAVKPKKQRDSDKPGDVLFAKLVPMKDGVAEFELDPTNSNDEFLVSATVFSGDIFDWQSVSDRFSLMPESFIELDLPKFIHKNDAAHGRVYFRSATSDATVTIQRDDQVIATFETSASDFPLKEAILCHPGSYVATMEMTGTDEVVRVEKEIFCPGTSKTARRPTVALQPGQPMVIDQSVREFQVLPSFDLPFDQLTKATCNYQHLCCEQTGAKIRAAIFSYLACPAEKVALKEAATESIIAGIKRLETMWIRGKGFMAYPNRGTEPDHNWGRLAAEHLLYIQLLHGVGASGSLSQAIDLGTEMGRDVGSLYKKRNHTWFAEAAYRTIRFSKEAAEVQDAKRFVRDAVIKSSFPKPDDGVGKSVWNRTVTAYLAAAMFVEPETGDIELGLKLASEIMSQIDENGRLYSTMDSAAAIVMLHEMNRCNASAKSSQPTRVKLDGELCDLNHLPELGNVSSIEAVDRPVIVRMEKIVETSWTQYAGNVPVEVSLLRKGNHELNYQVGDQIEMKVELTDGYRFGDFLDVCLPDSLSRVFGGGQVKQFAVDFAGKTVLTIPLATTGASFSADGKPAPHHFSILIRNMYDEERIACPAFLRVNVSQPELATA